MTSEIIEPSIFHYALIFFATISFAQGMGLMFLFNSTYSTLTQACLLSLLVWQSILYCKYQSCVRQHVQVKACSCHGLDNSTPRQVLLALVITLFISTTIIFGSHLIFYIHIFSSSLMDLEANTSLIFKRVLFTTITCFARLNVCIGSKRYDSLPYLSVFAEWHGCHLEGLGTSWFSDIPNCSRNCHVHDNRCSSDLWYCWPLYNSKLQGCTVTSTILYIAGIQLTELNLFTQRCSSFFNAISMLTPHFAQSDFYERQGSS